MVTAETENGGGAEDARMPKEVRAILHEIASKWGDVEDEKALEVVQLKGAMTNSVYQVNWKTAPPAEDSGGDGGRDRKVLLRIYGEGVEVFFDREVEIRTFECMSRHGQGPKLLGRFQTGRVEEFIHARLREFYDLDMPGLQSVFLWEILRNWCKAAQNLCSSEEAKEFRLDSIEEEITILQTELSVKTQRIGFCHNDLQYGNIMIDEETRLDYEYASYNPVPYDLANHFCEFAADYHTETPHILDYNKYPDHEERKRFIYIYLSSAGENPEDSEVEELVQDTEKYTLASHLLWGLWGIISEHVNEIDFNYMEYARQRFQQYWLRKPALLSSGTTPPTPGEPISEI
ncbi:hypothetical protein QJS04_geneDACA005467 [Acorus gramineus]|uniref:Choline kinase 1 n=1 Tax=Acorus gramineus TaxID=55184 RepID=A0AAV9A591_ACOGR|nr:hypothetical protein QJS04_geneDACA005467 [Acorus gramineus]